MYNREGNFLKIETTKSIETTESKKFDLMDDLKRIRDFAGKMSQEIINMWGKLSGGKESNDGAKEWQDIMDMKERVLGNISSLNERAVKKTDQELSPHGRAFKVREMLSCLNGELKGIEEGEKQELINQLDSLISELSEIQFAGDENDHPLDEKSQKLNALVDGFLEKYNLDEKELEDLASVEKIESKFVSLRLLRRKKKVEHLIKTELHKIGDKGLREKLKMRFTELDDFSQILAKHEKIPVSHERAYNQIIHKIEMNLIYLEQEMIKMYPEVLKSEHADKKRIEELIVGKGINVEQISFLTKKEQDKLWQELKEKADKREINEELSLYQKAENLINKLEMLSKYKTKDENYDFSKELDEVKKIKEKITEAAYIPGFEQKEARELEIELVLAEMAAAKKIGIERKELKKFSGQDFNITKVRNDLETKLQIINNIKDNPDILDSKWNFAVKDLFKGFEKPEELLERINSNKGKLNEVERLLGLNIPESESPFEEALNIERLQDAFKYELGNLENFLNLKESVETEGVREGAIEEEVGQEIVDTAERKAKVKDFVKDPQKRRVIYKALAIATLFSGLSIAMYKELAGEKPIKKELEDVAENEQVKEKIQPKEKKISKQEVDNKIEELKEKLVQDDVSQVIEKEAKELEKKLVRKPKEFEEEKKIEKIPSKAKAINAPDVLESTAGHDMEKAGKYFHFETKPLRPGYYQQKSYSRFDGSKWYNGPDNMEPVSPDNSHLGQRDIFKIKFAVGYGEQYMGIPLPSDVDVVKKSLPKGTRLMQDSKTGDVRVEFLPDFDYSHDINLELCSKIRKVVRNFSADELKVEKGDRKEYVDLILPVDPRVVGGFKIKNANLAYNGSPRGTEDYQLKLEGFPAGFNLEENDLEIEYYYLSPEKKKELSEEERQEYLQIPENIDLSKMDKIIEDIIEKNSLDAEFFKSKEAPDIYRAFQFRKYVAEKIVYGKTATMKDVFQEKGDQDLVNFVLENKMGDCDVKNTIFIMFCRKQGIPSRLVAGYLDNGIDEDKNSWGELKASEMHGWAEINIDGEWIRMDATGASRSGGGGAFSEGAMGEKMNDWYKITGEGELDGELLEKVLSGAGTLSIIDLEKMNQSQLRFLHDNLGEFANINFDYYRSIGVSKEKEIRQLLNYAISLQRVDQKGGFNSEYDIATNDELRNLLVEKVFDPDLVSEKSVMIDKFKPVTVDDAYNSQSNREIIVIREPTNEKNHARLLRNLFSSYLENQNSSVESLDEFIKKIDGLRKETGTISKKKFDQNMRAVSIFDNKGKPEIRNYLVKFYIEKDKNDVARIDNVQEKYSKIEEIFSNMWHHDVEFGYAGLELLLKENPDILKLDDKEMFNAIMSSGSSGLSKFFEDYVKNVIKENVSEIGEDQELTKKVNLVHKSFKKAVDNLLKLKLHPEKLNQLFTVLEKRRDRTLNDFYLAGEYIKYLATLPEEQRNMPDADSYTITTNSQGQAIKMSYTEKDQAEKTADMKRIIDNLQEEGYFDEYIDKLDGLDFENADEWQDLKIPPGDIAIKRTALMEIRDEYMEKDVPDEIVKKARESSNVDFPDDIIREIIKIKYSHLAGIIGEKKEISHAFNKVKDDFVEMSVLTGDEEMIMDSYNFILSRNALILKDVNLKNQAGEAVFESEKLNTEYFKRETTRMGTLLSHLGETAKSNLIDINISQIDNALNYESELSSQKVVFNLELAKLSLSMAAKDSSQFDRSTKDILGSVRDLTEGDNFEKLIKRLDELEAQELIGEVIDKSYEFSTDSFTEDFRVVNPDHIRDQVEIAGIIKDKFKDKLNGQSIKRLFAMNWGVDLTNVPEAAKKAEETMDFVKKWVLDNPDRVDEDFKKMISDYGLKPLEKIYGPAVDVDGVVYKEKSMQTPKNTGLSDFLSKHGKDIKYSKLIPKKMGKLTRSQARKILDDKYRKKYQQGK